jgi:hypothetical protein
MNTFFLKNPFFHIKLMYFSSFGSTSAVLGGFLHNYSKFIKIMYYLHM